MMHLPGADSLRSNVLNWDAETMWQTYALLNDVEAVFRSLKSELGVRPIVHHKEVRADGHLFISVLAYQAIHVLRKRLKHTGNGASWSTIRNALRPLQRTTTSFTRPDGRTLHVRKTAVADQAYEKVRFFTFGNKRGKYFLLLITYKKIISFTGVSDQVEETMSLNNRNLICLSQQNDLQGNTV